MKDKKMKRIFLFLIILYSIPISALASEQKLTSEYEQELIQRVKGVFGSGHEDVNAVGSIRPVCATPIFVELFANYDKLSPDAKKLLSFFANKRPDSSWTDPRTYDTESGHFKIHYVISGPDSVFESSVDILPGDGHPDYVNRCGEILDFVWEYEINTVGYNSPPPDGGFLPDGGDGKYDVYLTDLEIGYLGFTVPWYYTIYPKANSYIVLRSDYSIYANPPYPYDDQYDVMKVTAAHEFFHAIQMGYDADEWGGSPPNYKPYWMEMTAVWMEDMVYDQINDYLSYLEYFFYYPWLSLKTFSYDQGDQPRYYHAYAGCVWPIYLSERFGTDIIKDIWTRCGQSAGDNALLATDQALATRGYSFNQAFQEFTIWNYFTSSRADTINFYSEGHLFDPIFIYPMQNHSSYPVDVSSVLKPPENLGSNYVAFRRPSGETGGLNIGFYGDSSGSWAVSLIGYKIDNPSWFSQIDLDAVQNGTTYVSNWELYDKIIMIPAVTTQQGDTFRYTYTASIDTTVDVEEKDKNILSLTRLFQNYPNPFNSTTLIPFTVNGSQLTENGPLPTTLTVYNILGQKIKTLVDEEIPPGEYEVMWNGKDQKGIEVASGIYFYQIRVGQHSEIKKMLLVK
jgi:hypothetical protein